MKCKQILRGVLAVLALAVPALAAPPQYVGSLSVTQANGTKAFTNTSGDSAAFLARSITITASGANTCYLEYTSTLTTSTALAITPTAVVSVSIPIAPGATYTQNLGTGYAAQAGWSGLAGICSTGQTATWAITANRYEQPSVTISGGTPAGSDGNLQVKSGTSLAAFAGAAACTSGDFVTALSASGATTCGTPSAFSSAPLTLVNTGAGDGAATIRKSPSGSATSNFINSTGTFPANDATTSVGALFSYTTSGTGIQVQRGMELDILAGINSTASTQGFYVNMTAAGQNITNYLSFGGNIASIISVTSGGSSVTNTGLYVQAQGATNNIGGVFTSTSVKTMNVALASYALNATNNTAGLFVLGSSAINPTGSQALYAAVNAATGTIATFRKSGTTEVFRIDDTGLVLTSGKILSATTGLDIGSTTNPFRNVVLHLSGTYGTGSWTFAGTPTGNRTLTIPGDASDTIATLATANIFTAQQTLGGGALLTRVIEASTAGSGAPNVLVGTGSTQENFKVLTNEGATAEAYNTLPSAATGMTFTFYCQDTDGIRVTANTGDTIRLSGSVSASAGFVKSIAAGSSITLVAINATEWVAVSIVGTWTIDI